MKLMEKIKSIFSQTVALLKKVGLRRWLTIVICTAVVLSSAVVSVFAISLSIKAKTSSDIVSEAQSSDIQNIDHIIILGAGLRPDGSPSDMLADRLSVGVALLEHHPNAKLILTGDNSGDHYNEVASMKKYVLEMGVEEEAIIEDGRGYSTYESLYHIKNDLNAQNVIIVTQEYHLYRALYVAEQMGMDAVGVSANLRSYSRQTYRSIREHLARVKDFFYTLTEHVPTSA